MSQQQHRVWLISAVVLGTAAAVRAQEPPPPEPSAAERAKTATPEPESARFSLSVRGDLAFNADMHDGPGDVTVSRVGGDVGAVIPIGERARLTLGFDYEHSNYEFHDATGFIAGSDSPFREVNRETLSGSYYQQQTQRLGWLAGGSIGFTAEDGADLGKAVEGTVFGGVRYAVTERFFVGGGVYVGTQLEDNPYVWPLITLDWQISERWRLSTEGRPGVTLSYSPSERWTIYLAGEYQYRDFRLDRHGPAPSGVGRDRRVPLMLGVRFEPNRQLSLEGGAGVYFAQNFEILDSGGNKLVDKDVDATPFVQLELTYRF
jgi:hypothetical protein